MNGLKSATLWIVIFLVFILMFMQYGEREQPKKLDLTKVVELAEAKKLTKVVDKGGKLEGQYLDAGEAKIQFVSQYLPGQEQKIFEIADREQEGRGERDGVDEHGRLPFGRIARDLPRRSPPGVRVAHDLTPVIARGPGG